MLTVAFIIILYLFSTPLLTRLLRSQLERARPFDWRQKHHAQAIVVLGADRYRRAPEYDDQDTLGELALQRVRYAAWLHKHCQLPLLASGGSPGDATGPEAVIIREILRTEYGCEVEWIESRSRTTFENAIFSAEILKQQNIEHILLVTHAWHLPRAAEAFRFAGLKVTPAGTGYYRPAPAHCGSWALLPSISAMYLNRLCMHEILGRLWYHLKYYHSRAQAIQAE